MGNSTTAGWVGDYVKDPVHIGIIERMAQRYLSRRCLIQGIAAGMATLGAAAKAGRQAQAADAIQAYPFGTKPVAPDVKGAIDFWLGQMKTAAPDDHPDVVLTAQEIETLRARKLKPGHTWYGLFVPAVAGWNRFWQAEVKKWAADVVIYDVQGKPERDIAGVQLMIDQGLPIIGALAVDWIVMGEAMRKLHAANIPSVSCTGPASAYYPTTSSAECNQLDGSRDLAMPMARKLRSTGITESEMIMLPAKSPSFYDVVRTIGFLQGLELPEVKKVCDMKIVAEMPVATGTEEALAATAAALQKYPKTHVIAALGHWFAGSSAAIRDAGRQDVWVIAYDLDQGTAVDLVSGGWPVQVTYSLPIAQSAKADANLMGKILLGKRVPLMTKSFGTVTTPENVAQAWAHDWNGEKMPF